MPLTRSFTRNNPLIDPELPNNNNNITITSTPTHNATNQNITQNLNTVPSTTQEPNIQTISTPLIQNSFKLPTFMTNCPEAWFLLIEGQFLIQNITNDFLKFHYVFCALPQEVITKIIDIVNPPPTENKYQCIKKTLLERFSISDEEKLEQLLSNSQLGDRKPSELYRDLKSLVSSDSIISQELLFKLWFRKLPQYLQVHLTSSSDKSVNEQIILADKLINLTSRNQNCSVIGSSDIKPLEQCIQNLTQLTTTLYQHIDKINLDVAELKTDRRNFQHYTSGVKSPSRSKYSNNQNNLCWYHQKFGDKAFKCIKPCKFFNKNCNSNSFESSHLN